MRFTATLAIGVLALTVAAFVIGLGLLLVVNAHAGLNGQPLHQFLSFPGAFLSFTVVGTFIALRRPRNPIGWMLGAVGLSASATLLGDGYGLFSLRVPGGPHPGGVIAAWARWWVWIPAFIILPFLLWLFPDGRWLSRRWRRCGSALIGIALTSLAIGWFAPGPLPLPQFAELQNPFGIAGLAGIAEANATVGAVTIFVAYPLAVVSLFLRFRRSSGPERQQLKWVASAGALYAALFVSLVAAWVVYPNFDPEAPYPLAAFAGVPHGLAVASIAGAIGVAILRYRLYDIDVLINRTLVYAAVTAVLAATYFAAVVLIQAALRPFTAGSELAVAASTLLVVALFQPLRRRVQGAVDRRFYRSRYDAQRTLGVFSVRLRDQVDLDDLRADLLDIVDETLRPAHKSMWLRERAR